LQSDIDPSQLGLSNYFSRTLFGETGAAEAQSQIFPCIETPSEDIDEIFSLYHKSIPAYFLMSLVVTANMRKIAFHREPHENTIAPTRGA
jgi:hypothetical protein